MNAYFQLLGEDHKTFLRLVPPTEDGQNLESADIIDYLNFNKIMFDLPSLNAAVTNLESEQVVLLNNDELIPVNEELFIEIDDDRIHIDEHIRYILSEYDELTAEEKQRLFAHVKSHKERIKQTEIKGEINV